MTRSLTGILLSFILTLTFSTALFSQKKVDPPAVVIPGKGNTPPSDALILFNGGDLAKFTSVNSNSPAPWKVSGSIFTVVPETGSIQTKEEFGDIQLHIEFRIPLDAKKTDGQKSGNSGIYLMGKYEIQVLNSFRKETSPFAQAGAIYGQSPPLVNASLQPGKWQVYDIIFSAPRYNNKGEMEKYPLLTVFHNGILIQDHVEVKGPTPAYNAELPEGTELGPLMLQDHLNKVSYRNIWVRKL